MIDFKMPKLGADMDEGTLIEWNVSPGDKLKKGDIIAVVDTAKGAIDIEVFRDAVVDALLVEPGTLVEVGAVMAKLRSDEEPPEFGPDGAAEPAEIESEETFARPAATATKSIPSQSVPIATLARPAVSPWARRLARQLSIDIANIAGSGPQGSVVAADVQAAANSKATGKSASSPSSKSMRQAIAAAMSRAKREIPHYYLTHDMDVTPLLAHIENWNEAHSIQERLLPALLYYKAIAIAAAEHKSLNGRYENGALQPSPAVHLGIAISLRGGGLVAPCLLDAAQTDTVTLMKRLKDLVKRTRKGGLKASELSQGTLTVSNLGDRGVDALAGVIYPPQVALVGIGSARQRPWVINDSVQPRHIVTFSLAADHRVSDGHAGALFLRRVDELLQTPAEL